MTHPRTLARHWARLRALLLVPLAISFAACDADEYLTTTPEETPADFVDPVIDADQRLADSLAREDSIAFANGDPTGGLPIDDEDDSGVGDEEQGEEELVFDEQMSAQMLAFAGGRKKGGSRKGIPFGTYHLPLSQYGKYNGSLGNISPGSLIRYLETARRTGTRVVLSLSGSEKTYRSRNHAFSLSMWKARINRYRGLNLTPFIKDGTIIGHYLMDEPHDRGNWGGRVVSRATIDEMAKYSKQLWPGMATIIRSWPAYLKGYRYRYLDAAWAQYSAEYGASSQRLPIARFMAKNVSEAKSAGLGLVIGMNQLAGGTRRNGLRGFYRNRYAPSAGELRSWGQVMLSNSYPCAFISWKYDTRYMGRRDIKSALATLSGKARNRSNSSCRKGGGGGGGRDDDD